MSEVSMFRRLGQRLTYANVMSTLAVFLTLGTGSAYATHLVVRSSDVVDGTLVSADLANDSAVAGVDVVDGSLSGADIVESTLRQVPRATIGGLGRFSNDFFACNPEDHVSNACVVVSIHLPSPARVLVTGNIVAYKEVSDSGQRVAECVLGSNSGMLGGTQTLVDISGDESLSLVGITDALPAGRHTFGIDCSDPEGDVAYRRGQIAAVAISPS